MASDSSTSKCSFRSVNRGACLQSNVAPHVGGGARPITIRHASGPVGSMQDSQDDTCYPCAYRHMYICAVRANNFINAHLYTSLLALLIVALLKHD